MGRRWQLRDKENFINYVKIELQLLAKEWKIILPCVFMQYAHAIFHNLAYYIQAHYLSTEQRFTLHDLGYELMGELTGWASDLSDILVQPGRPGALRRPQPRVQPASIGELFTRLDSLNGCGDLMFSSHTIYTVSFILTVWKYWPNKYGISIMVLVQITIAFLIVASRKHYTLDVFSALYIVPLFWLALEAYHKDINNKDTEVTVKTIYDFYGIDVSSDANDGAVPLNTTDVVPPQAAPLNSVQVALTEDESLSGERSDPDTSFQRKNSV
ncbi:hypothetical protein AM588_10003927 [Phytophthora nicotianae]|uniref:Sphingomyelin synthase-like domain-containing protein n=1 Tax=Phytophthora nicotianae TaxID=4792 RepID=A0A0W8D7V5_PHYNI|nr:hypothetical protein AM588_10003927 [Phytophthora nicotianae]